MLKSRTVDMQKQEPRIVLLNATKIAQIFDKFRIWMPQRNHVFDKFESLLIEKQDRKEKFLKFNS